MSEIIPTASPEPTLHRALNVRMLSMIAIGGSIGTGIFLASGNSISMAGPGGTLVAYLLIGVMVYFLMTSLGEMAAYLPSTGSFYVYAARFVDPALGYALGWNYWYNWAICVASEISAAAVIMHFWFPHSPPVLWSSLFMAIFVGLNLFSARGFGEAEYWFSLIKVATIIVFITVGTAIILGLTPEPSVGLKNWTIGDAPFHGGITTIFAAFLIAGFSFQGTEVVGIAAGESADPAKNIPRAVRRIFWRILLFFVLSIIIISTLIPYTAPQLTNSDVSMSPFTLIFRHVGITFAASLMNAVILTAILSAGNSGMYAASRMLWYLAKQGHVPKCFAKVSRRGVPIYALGATTLVAMLTFLSAFFGDGKVYLWLLNATSVTGFIAWFGIAISHYRFRKAYVKQGHDIKKLPYVAKGYPFAPLFALSLCIIIIAGQNYSALTGGKIDWSDLVISYAGVVAFVTLWLGYKLIYKTKVVPLMECKFTSAENE